MTLRDLHYAWPWAVNLIFAAPLFALLLWALYRYRRQRLQKADFIAVSRSKLYFVLQSTLLLIAWLSGTVALMQPLANGRYPEGRPKPAEAVLRRPAHEVILLVDASASMTVTDMHNGQSRLDYAKQLADEFVSDLDGEQVSLYAFTSELSPLSPPTLDYLFVRMMLESIQINQDGITGTDYYAALVELRKRLLDIPATTLKTIVLFTDGGDTAIEAAGEAEKDKLTGALLELIKGLLKANVRLYTVGMGTLQGKEISGVAFDGKPVVSKLDEPLLKQMADAGNGKYLSANDLTVIAAADQLAGRINALSKGAQGQDIDNTVIAGEEAMIYDHYFQYPLAVAIAALLLALFLPEVRSRSALKAFGTVLLLAFPLEAQEFRPNEILYEAGLYSRTLNKLDQDAAGKLKTWQKYVVLYDKGTVYLHEKEWGQAIEVLTSIPFSSDLISPILLSNIYTNLGIAYLGKSRALEMTSPPPYPLIIAQRTEAARAFRKAGETAMPNSDSVILQKDAQIERAGAYQRSAEAMMETDALSEGLPLLLFSVSNSMAFLRFLDRDWVDDKWKEQYVQLIGKQGEAWQPLWQSQLDNWKSVSLNEVKRKEGIDLFQKAAEQNRTAFGAIRSGNWLKAHENFDQASQALTACMRVLYGEDPIQDVLRRLLGSYQRVLAQDTLNEGAIAALVKEQEQLMESGKGAGLTASFDSLKGSLAALQQGQVLPAELLLKSARQEVKNALFKLEVLSPRQYLESVIDQQYYAGGALNLRLQMKESSPLIHNEWVHGQAEVLKMAAGFLPTVLKYQDRIYHGNGPRRCQGRPWDKALPLFEEGRDKAELAQRLLEAGDMLSALQKEAAALIAFQQALDLIKNPIDDDSSPCQSSSQSQSSDKSAQEKPQQQPQPKMQINNVLRVLQELNEEDQLPKTNQGIKQQGLRPW